MNSRTFRIVALASSSLAAMAVQPASAQDSDNYLQLSTGIDYSSGDYGDTVDTDMLSVPVTLKLQANDFFLRASVSYLSVDGPADVIPGDGGVTGGGAGGPAVSRDGIGDLNLAAGYSFNLGGGTYFDVTGKLKVPTASESKGLGTGTTDVTAEAELFHSFGDVSGSLRGGRRFNGSSAAFPLQDVWLAGAGLYYSKNDLTLGLDYDWREGSLPTSADRSELTGSATFRLNQALRLQTYAYTGFSNGSPDLGGGAQILYRFGM